MRSRGTALEDQRRTDALTVQGLLLPPAPHRASGTSARRKGCLPHQLPRSCVSCEGQESRNIRESRVRCAPQCGGILDVPFAAPVRRMRALAWIFSPAPRSQMRGASGSPRSRDTSEGASAFAMLCKHHLCLVPQHFHVSQAHLPRMES